MLLLAGLRGGRRLFAPPRACVVLLCGWAWREAAQRLRSSHRVGSGSLACARRSGSGAGCVMSGYSVEQRGAANSLGYRLFFSECGRAGPGAAGCGAAAERGTRQQRRPRRASWLRIQGEGVSSPSNKRGPSAWI